MCRLLVLVLGLTVSSTVNADPYLGLPKLPIPADNSQTVDKIALGRQLFNDKRLSIDGSVSCASCHQTEKAFTDGLPLARGVANQIGVRNTPSLLNAAFYQTQFLDGRAASLEEQALGPFVNPREHGLQNQRAILEIVLRDFEYVKVL